MIFTPTKFDGTFLLTQQRMEDERGFFARTFCAEEFRERGLYEHFVQCSISHNKAKGTLRGMHFQSHPYEEVKLVACIRGGIFDVIVDLRKDSSTYLLWEGFELTPENGRMLYIPQGFAHGFLTLSDESDVYYQMSVPYHKECATGISYQNKRVGIHWPVSGELVISTADRERDKEYLP